MLKGKSLGNIQSTMSKDLYDKLLSLFETDTQSSPSKRYEPDPELENHVYEELVIGVTKDELDGDMPQYPLVFTNTDAKFIDNPNDTVSSCFE